MVFYTVRRFMNFWWFCVVVFLYCLCCVYFFFGECMWFDVIGGTFTWIVSFLSDFLLYQYHGLHDKIIEQSKILNDQPMERKRDKNTQSITSKYTHLTWEYQHKYIPKPHSQLKCKWKETETQKQKQNQNKNNNTHYLRGQPWPVSVNSAEILSLLSHSNNLAIR